jgi:hypothetical protein
MLEGPILGRIITLGRGLGKMNGGVEKIDDIFMVGVPKSSMFCNKCPIEHYAF